jgi:hypothetical protein
MAINSREFSEWQAYSRIEPFGFVRDNLMAGLTTAAVYNVHRDPRKRSAPFQPGDFRLRFTQRATNAGAGERVRMIFERLRGMFGSTKHG